MSRSLHGLVPRLDEPGAKANCKLARPKSLECNVIGQFKMDVRRHETAGVSGNARCRAAIVLVLKIIGGRAQRLGKLIQTLGADTLAPGVDPLLGIAESDDLGVLGQCPNQSPLILIGVLELVD